MKIESIRVTNFKSLVDLKISNLLPFSVFVGPNASGKSNIFEAIEFIVASSHMSLEVDRLFGGVASILNRKRKASGPETDSIEFEIKLDTISPEIQFIIQENMITGANSGQLFYPQSESDRNWMPEDQYWETSEYKQFFRQHSRIFVNSSTEKIPFQDDKKLSTACRNLEKVLKRILKDEIKKEEITEWLQLLVPGLENVQIRSEELSGTDSLLIYEKGNTKPFPKQLISDGTFNIIALLTAVYQSDEPQFLCIEEPENGLNPKVIKELVTFFREQCEEKGHYIWLNTHSQTLVRQLSPEELIVVDKVDGETKIKQFQGKHFHGLKMDEALLSGVLGGGIPW